MNQVNLNPQTVPLMLLTALLSWIAVGLFVGYAKRKGLGQRVRTDGPQSHLVKEGLPTMGGVPFSVIIFIVWLLFAPKSSPTIWAAALMALGMGLVGFIDDVSLVKSRASGSSERGGLKARQKLPLQLLCAGLFAIVAAREIHATGMGWLDVLLYTLACVASVNAVNYTDGADGLAGGVVLIALLPLMLASPLAAISIAALLGYLWFNARPASIIMGDAGSHALGGILAGVYIAQGWIWVLPIAAIIPVLEILSSSLQILYFRRTGGKRLFKMAPLHHHFELSGWSEGKVVIRFYIVTALATLLAWWLKGGSQP